MTDFLRRSALVVVTALERISAYRELVAALDLAHLKGDIVGFMFTHGNYGEIREFIGRKVCEIVGAQHLLLISDDGSRNDWFGENAPQCCARCVESAINRNRRLPVEIFAHGETLIVPDGAPLPDMNLPKYCPIRSTVVSQFRKNGG